MIFLTVCCEADKVKSELKLTTALKAQSFFFIQKTMPKASHPTLVTLDHFSHLKLSL